MDIKAIPWYYHRLASVYLPSSRMPATGICWVLDCGNNGHLTNSMCLTQLCAYILDLVDILP